MPKPTKKAPLTPADLAAAKRLKAAWEARARERGLTQQIMATRIGRTQGLVSNYLNGVIALNYKALMQFCAALGIDDPTTIRGDLPELKLAKRVANLKATSDEPSSIGSIREPDSPGYDVWRDVLAYAQSASLGDGALPEDYAESHRLKFRASSLRRQGLRVDDLRVFYGRGDSMLPRVHDGDAVLFNTAQTTPEDGALFVIERDGELYVKRCDIIDRIVYFRSDNPDGDHQWKKPRRVDDPAHPIDILGRVRWIGSWE